MYDEIIITFFEQIYIEKTKEDWNKCNYNFGYFHYKLKEQDEYLVELIEYIKKYKMSDEKFKNSVVKLERNKKQKEIEYLKEKIECNEEHKQKDYIKI
ncbi:MAG: hypothetical protein ACOCWG_06010, partial [bacterium]